MSELKMRSNQVQPNRLKLVKQALSTNPTKEDFTEVLKEAKYNEANIKRYQALRQFNEDTGADITELRDYKETLKKVENTTIKEVKKSNPTMTAREAEHTTKELNNEAKKKAVKSIKIKKDTFHKPTYEALEAEVSKLKAELKKEKALKKQYHTTIKERDLEKMTYTQFYDHSCILDGLMLELKDFMEVADRVKANQSFYIEQGIGKKLSKAEDKIRDLLGAFKVTLDTPLSDQKKKYRAIANKYHPDKYQGKEVTDETKEDIKNMMADINEWNDLAKAFLTKYKG
jgi:DnaJ-domain-containing protein 1